MLNTAHRAADFHRAEGHAAGTPFNGLGILAVGVITVAALYFGREVFVPMALALLLSFALGPPVLLLRNWHFNRVLAVIAVVVLAFSVIFGVGAVIGSQLAQLAESLPGYHTNITEKVHSLRDTTTSSGVVGRATGMLSDLGPFHSARRGAGSSAHDPGVGRCRPPP
jgi:predicted PurR-regulated permease PerM